MTDRLNKIFIELCECDRFADIGCDHGYMAKAMLESKKAKSVIISDISAKCLKKAEDLLAEDIALGRAFSVVSNGFERVKNCDLALIAGMGGEEIVSILKQAKSLPEKLVLQPMKNSDKVRRIVLELGYKINKDYTFESGKKFYDLIVLKKGEDSLSEEEIEFGKTNILSRPKAFVNSINFRLKKVSEYLKKNDLSEETKKDLQSQMEKLKKYVEV